ncbi:MAG: hypothetical protein H7843_15980 [Nitrospirota bacterium]
MILNNDDKLLILITVLSVTLLITVCAGVAAECEYQYYYVSIKNRDNYKTRVVRIMDMIVFDAYIYDLPTLPSSWVYDLSNNQYSDGTISYLSAAAKSDKHTIKYQDLENFIILRQPKNKSEENKIHIKLTILDMTEKTSTIVKLFDTNEDDFTVQKIDKCLPEKPRRH